MIYSMADNKTQPTDVKVEDFLNQITPEGKRQDAFTILKLMKQITRKKPVMWGPSIVGFGEYHYKYASGREGDFFVTGFSPRKQNLTIYIMPGFARYASLMKKLGKHTTGSSCLYIKSLDDIHMPTLKQLITESVAQMAKDYP